MPSPRKDVHRSILLTSSWLPSSSKAMYCTFTQPPGLGLCVNHIMLPNWHQSVKWKKWNQQITPNIFLYFVCNIKMSCMFFEPIHSRPISIPFSENIFNDAIGSYYTDNVKSLQSHIILTMSHWSSGLPGCFPSQGTQVQIPWGDLCETGILLLALSR